MQYSLRLTPLLILTLILISQLIALGLALIALALKKALIPNLYPNSKPMLTLKPNPNPEP